MKTICLVLLVFCTLIAGGQQLPDCPKTLDSVKAYMERNYVGFNDKVKPATQKAYEVHTLQSFQLAKAAKTRSDHFYTIHHWLGFFQDHHIEIEVPSDTSTIETILLNEKQLNRLSRTAGLSVEGIYHTQDSVYKVAVIKSSKGLRSYAAVILHSKAPSWKPGQVKFELVQTGKDRYDGIWYNRNHNVYFSAIQFTGKNGLATEGWIKEGAVAEKENVQPLFEEERNTAVFYKKINDSTGYLRVKDFDGSYAKKIDSVLKANQQYIQSMPKLIIDVRGNGGGSDYSMSFIKPIIYTDPVKGIGPDLLATPDNIAAWEYLINLYRDQLPKDYLDGLQQKINKGKGKERALISYAPDFIDTLPAVWPTPSKVAIVINQGCGSSTEEFLLFASQSRKVILAGEHSKGVLDYSNVVQKDFYAPSFTLHYPTTRSRRVDIGQGIDNVGIQPDIPLDLSKKSWLEELLKRL